MPHITNICNTTFSLYHIATICNTTFSCSLPQSDPKYTVPLIVQVSQSRTIVHHALVSNIRLHTRTILHQSELYHPHHAKLICTMGCIVHQHMSKHGAPCHCPPWYTGMVYHAIAQCPPCYPVSKQRVTMGCTSTCQSTVYHAIAHPGIQYQTMSLPPQPVLLSAVPSHMMQNYGEPYTAPANVKPW